MAYVNLDNLADIQPINLSFNLTNSSQAINTVKDNVQTGVGDFWFYAMIWVLFLMLIWWFYRPDKNFLFDLTRSVLFASSWCFFVSVAFILSGWVNTIYPIIWFATIFTISVVGASKLKTKSL